MDSGIVTVLSDKELRQVIIALDERREYRIEVTEEEEQICEDVAKRLREKYKQRKLDWPES